MKIITMAALSGAVVLAGCQPSFRQADIDNLKSDISRAAEEQGFAVSDVQMINESATKATGFAKIYKAVPGLGRIDVTWSCEATMGSDGKRYIWSCKP